MDVKAYLDSLAQTAGLDAESKANLLKAIENEKFATALSGSLSRQEDYSRNMDALRKDREGLEAEKSTWREWYAKAVEQDAAREAELVKLRGGQPTNTTTTSTSINGGLTKADLEKILAQERGSLIAVTKAMGRIASRHAAEFKEALDVDAVEKIAIERGIRVEDAYEQYVAPRVAERQKAEFEQKLKDAHDAGVKEGMSKHGIPDDASTPRGHHLLFDRPKVVDPNAKLGDRQRLDNFAEAWNSQPATPMKQ
jgi:hypothetical protein